MDVGLNLLCVTGFVRDEHLPLIERAKAAGFDGVEVPVFEGSPDDYAALARQLDALDLKRTCCAIVPGPSVSPVSEDAAVRQRGRAHLGWAVECALALGAESIGGPFHAPIGHFTGAGPTESELAHGAEAHRWMAEEVAPHGVILSLEPLNRFETYFLITTEQARAYAERVGHPAFRIMYDTFHANIEERDPVAAFGTIAPHAGVTHIAENDRGIPGRGHIPFAETFRAVRGSGFDGWLVIEAFGGSVPELAAATRVWRPLFPDIDTLITESLAFVRRGWDGAAA